MGRENFFFQVKLKLIHIKRITELENHHLPIILVATDSGKNCQRILKLVSENLRIGY